MKRPLAVWIVLGSTLVACPAEPVPRESNTPSPTPIIGGTVSALAVEDLDSLDPHLAARPSSWFVARAVHRGLLTYPALGGDRPIPDLARVVASTRSRFGFRLEDDVRFSDGRRIRPGDVKASLERLIAGGRGIAPWLDVIDGAARHREGRAANVTGIRLEGARRIEITLSRPSGDLASMLAHPQAAIVPADTPAIGADPLSIVGAGPYRIARYDPERRIVLERSGAAPGPEVPTFDRLDVTVGGSVRSAVESIARGDADLLLEPGPLDTYRDLLGPSDVEPACIRYVRVDTTEPPFDRARAVAAAHAAVASARLALSAHGEPATSLLPPGVQGSSDTTPVATTRVSDAPVVALRVGDTPVEGAEGDAIAAALTQMGFTVEVDRVASEQLLRSDEGANVRLGTWCPDWPWKAARNTLGALVAGIPDLTADVAAAARGNSVTRWRRLERRIAGAGWFPLLYLRPLVVASPRLGGPIGSPALPSADPFALWVGP